MLPSVALLCAGSGDEAFHVVRVGAEDPRYDCVSSDRIVTPACKSLGSASIDKAKGLSYSSKR